MDLEAEWWWRTDLPQARRLAAQVADDVGATLVGVWRHEVAGTPGKVALFDVDGQPFALVPGAHAHVGYDAAGFAPTAEQQQSYAKDAELGLPPDPREFVDEYTSPPRTATVPALLVAVDAVQTDAVSYEQEVARLAAAGQRLLTPDEWEYACGAGARTLFRWGEFQPPGEHPHAAVTGPHREPNVFGLTIAQDPYQAERTADPAVVCGGDGGAMMCGGAGEFLCWLTLATAYRDPEYAAFLQSDDAGEDGCMLVRPAIPLS